MTASRLVIRPATREDLERFGELQTSVTAFVGEVEGEIIGLGGLAYAGGKVVAFLNVKPEAGRYGKSLHKAGLMVMRGAQEAGHRFVYASAQPEIPTADRWLRRLGFVETEPGKYRWSAHG